MGATILDALIAQARSAVTRAYLMAGVLPALMMFVGREIYLARSIDKVEAQLKSAVALDPNNVTASAAIQILLVAIVGALLYGGRGAFLRMLQEVPGSLLQPWRRDLITIQSVRWWQTRRQLAKDDASFTTINLFLAALDALVKNGKLPEPDGGAGPGDATIPAARRSSTDARHYVNDIAPAADSASWPLGEQIDVDRILAGARGFLALPVKERESEAVEWMAIYGRDAARSILQHIRAQLARRAIDTARINSDQPEREQALAPTRLGNRVAALDDYAGRRYGIQTMTLWTRLWGALGHAERQEVTSAQLRVETFANLTVAFALTAIGTIAASLGPMVVRGRADYWTLACIALFGALAVLSYKGAVYAFSGVSDAIIRYIDLYRVRVLLTFGLAAPKTFREEQEMFADLERLFAHADATEALKDRVLREIKIK